MAVPIRLKSRTDKVMIFRFPTLDASIDVVLTRWEVNLAAMHEGKCYDFLACFEALPYLEANGYRCGLCYEDVLERFESREKLWEQHLFEPFLEWVNQELAGNPTLEFHSIGDGGTWAKLNKTTRQTSAGS